MSTFHKFIREVFLPLSQDFSFGCFTFTKFYSFFFFHQTHEFFIQVFFHLDSRFLVRFYFHEILVNNYCFCKWRFFVTFSLRSDVSSHFLLQTTHPSFTIHLNFAPPHLHHPIFTTIIIFLVWLHPFIISIIVFTFKNQIFQRTPFAGGRYRHIDNVTVHNPSQPFPTVHNRS